MIPSCVGGAAHGGANGGGRSDVEHGRKYDNDGGAACPRKGNGTFPRLVPWLVNLPLEQ